MTISKCPLETTNQGETARFFRTGLGDGSRKSFDVRGWAMSSRDTMRFWRPLGAYGLFVLLNACHSVDSTAARPAVEERRAVVLKVTGDANGLCWDDRTQTLYLADDDGNRILSWTDKTGFVVVKQLPAVLPKAPGLGQLVVLANGTLVVTRFGHGSVGDIVFIPPSGEPSVIPGLEPKRRRIGLSASADGRLFDAWFEKLENGERAGAVGELKLSGGESELIHGLKKPVGVLVVGDQLFVSDQELGEILKAPLASPASYTVFAHVPAPDLLAAGPDGSILTGGAGGVLYRVSAWGSAWVMASGFHQVRGVAYDPTHQRVFVADHADHDGEQRLHVLPLR